MPSWYLAGNERFRGAVIAGAAPAVPPFLDPNANAVVNGDWSSGTSFNLPAMTATNNNVIIIVYITVNGLTGSDRASVSDGANTYNQRGDSTQVDFMEFFAPAASAPSGLVLTVSFTNAPSFATATAFAVAGANFASPFDPNASIPTEANGSSPSVATTNPNTLVIAGSRNGDDVDTHGTGFILIKGRNFSCSQYQQFTAAQGSIAVSYGTGSLGRNITDAVTA